MKATTVYSTMNTVVPTYPNAADRRYFLRRLLDGVLAVATAAGAITALIFLILL